MNRAVAVLGLLVLTGATYLGGLEGLKLKARFRSMEERLERVEDRLGGEQRLGFTETEVVQMVRRSVVRIVGGEGEGSGFAVRKGGYILTNFHVIEFEPSPKVIFPDHAFETANVVMADKDTDLAVVKVERELPVVPLARLESLMPAEELLSIGYAMGGDMPGEPFVSRGVFSTIRSSRDGMLKFVESNITMIGGMSGGPIVNMRGEAVGINKGGLLFGGLGLAVSSDTIRRSWANMAASKDPLKDVEKIVFEPDKSPLEAVRCFYNYLKVRNLEKAFALLSDHFKKGYSFEHWARGYEPLLDTSVVKIEEDQKIPNRIHVRLATKDLAGEYVEYKYFEGYWDVRKIGGKFLLWHPRIREVEDPSESWADIELDQADGTKNT